MRGAATEADLGDHLIGFQQRHVFQDKADHALTLALRSGRIVPQAREVRYQRHHLPTLVGPEHPAFGGALTLEVLLDCGEAAWCSTPLRENLPPGGCEDRLGASIAE